MKLKQSHGNRKLVELEMEMEMEILKCFVRRVPRPEKVTRKKINLSRSFDFSVVSVSAQLRNLSIWETRARDSIVE